MEHLFIFSLLATSVLSYSSGPPSSTCSSLTPGHSGITYNENSANLKIDILDASKGLITVAINSQKPFKGEIIIFFFTKKSKITYTFQISKYIKTPQIFHFLQVS